MASAGDDGKKVVRIATDAAADWLIQAGKIQHRGEFKINKTFRDYNVSQGEFINLSSVIIGHVEDSTGQSFHLPVDVRRIYHGGSVNKFLTALPGHSSTPPKGPIRPRK